MAVSADGQLARSVQVDNCQDRAELARFVIHWQWRLSIDLSVSFSTCSFAYSSLPEHRNFGATPESIVAATSSVADKRCRPADDQAIIRMTDKLGADL